MTCTHAALFNFKLFMTVAAFHIVAVAVVERRIKWCQIHGAANTSNSKTQKHRERTKLKRSDTSRRANFTQVRKGLTAIDYNRYDEIPQRTTIPQWTTTD
jgi:hypothetical protein